MREKKANKLLQRFKLYYIALTEQRIF